MIEPQSSTHSTVRGNTSGISAALTGTAIFSSGEKMPLRMLTPTTTMKMVWRSNTRRQPRGVQDHEERDARHRHPERRDEREHDPGHDRMGDEDDRPHQPVGQAPEPAVDVIGRIGRQEKAEEKPADQRPEQNRERVIREVEVPVRPPEIHGRRDATLPALAHDRPLAAPAGTPASGADRYRRRAADLSRRARRP